MCLGMIPAKFGVVAEERPYFSISYFCINFPFCLFLSVVPLLSHYYAIIAPTPLVIDSINSSLPRLRRCVSTPFSFFPLLSMVFFLLVHSYLLSFSLVFDCIVATHLSSSSFPYIFYIFSINSSSFFLNKSLSFVFPSKSPIIRKKVIAWSLYEVYRPTQG